MNALRFSGSRTAMRILLAEGLLEDLDRLAPQIVGQPSLDDDTVLVHALRVAGQGRPNRPMALARP